MPDWKQIFKIIILFAVILGGIYIAIGPFLLVRIPYRGVLVDLDEGAVESGTNQSLIMDDFDYLRIDATYSGGTWQIIISFNFYNLRASYPSASLTGYTYSLLFNMRGSISIPASIDSAFTYSGFSGGGPVEIPLDTLFRIQIYSFGSTSPPNEDVNATVGFLFRSLTSSFFIEFNSIFIFRTGLPFSEYMLQVGIVLAIILGQIALYYYLTHRKGFNGKDGKSLLVQIELELAKLEEIENGIQKEE